MKNSSKMPSILWLSAGCLFTLLSFGYITIQHKKDKGGDERYVLTKFKKTLVAMQDSLKTDSALYLQAIYLKMNKDSTVTPPSLYTGEFLSTCSSITYFHPTVCFDLYTCTDDPETFLFLKEQKVSDTLFYYYCTEYFDQDEQTVTPIAAITPDNKIIQLDTTHLYPPGYLSKRIVRFVDGVIAQKNEGDKTDL